MKSIRASRRAAGALGGAAAALLGGAGPAWPHAFGARYDLPLPLDFYLIGAGAAVALSFVIIALAVRVRPGAAEPVADDISGLAPVRALTHPAVAAAVGAVSVALLVVVLAAGLFGSQVASENLAPTFIWIIWWVGLAYLAALIGDPWPAISPWSIVFAGIERLVRALGGGRPCLGLAYPGWLGAWPAVVLFALFAWLELVSEAASRPASLAAAALAYSVVTWLGMAAFGRRAWLANGEAFALAFSVFGRFAPIGRPGSEAGGDRGGLHLRSYGEALVTTTPCRLSMTAFVLTMLATVTFDGFKETPLWGTLLGWLAVAPALGPAIRAIHDLGFDFALVLETVVMALFPALFLAAFLTFSWLTARAARDRRPLAETAGLFVWSLVPIAIAYHLAHYLSYLLLSGQRIIPLASDPFGLGWDLFGTAGYRTDIGVIGAELVWYVSVVSIVAGHVLAVAIAHRVALRVYAAPRDAVRSQLPLLGLMVGYTMLSLWILAQPIVGTPNLGAIDARSGTLTLAPFELRELCLDLEANDEMRYAFEADRPVAFDVHYHEGLELRFVAGRKEAAARAGRFVADRARTYCIFFMNQGLAPAELRYAVEAP